MKTRIRVFEKTCPNLTANRSSRKRPGRQFLTTRGSLLDNGCNRLSGRRLTAQGTPTKQRPTRLHGRNFASCSSSSRDIASDGKQRPSRSKPKSSGPPSSESCRKLRYEWAPRDLATKRPLRRKRMSTPRGAFEEHPMLASSAGQYGTPQQPTT